jgi:hypothetical protein
VRATRSVQLAWTGEDGAKGEPSSAGRVSIVRTKKKEQERRNGSLADQQGDTQQHTTPVAAQPSVHVTTRAISPHPPPPPPRAAQYSSTSPFQPQPSFPGHSLPPFFSPFLPPFFFPFSLPFPLPLPFHFLPSASAFCWNFSNVLPYFGGLMANYE